MEQNTSKEILALLFLMRGLTSFNQMGYMQS